MHILHFYFVRQTSKANTEKLFVFLSDITTEVWVKLHIKDVSLKNTHISRKLIIKIE